MLKFIGNGSAFNKDLGNTSAFIKHEDTMFLIDCGSNTFDRILTAKLLDDVNHLAIAITHFHPDHIGSLGDLVFYCYYIKKLTPVILTKQSHMLKTIAMYMGWSNCCVIKQIGANEKIYHNGEPIISILPVGAIHDDNIDSYGFYIGYMQAKVFYSGDTREIKLGALCALWDGEINAIYHDACGLDYEGNVHTSLRKLEKEVPRNDRQYVHLMHLDKAFDRELAEYMGFKVTKNIFDK